MTGTAAFIEREVPCVHLYEGTQEGLWTFSCCRKARMAFHQGHRKSRDNIGRLCAALTLQARNPKPSEAPQIRTGSVCIYTVGLNHTALCYTVLMSFQKKPILKKTASSACIRFTELTVSPNRYWYQHLHMFVHESKVWYRGCFMHMVRTIIHIRFDFNYIYNLNLQPFQCARINPVNM